MPITHPFVSAVVDDNTPTGGVGPDEWNASHTIDIGFLALNDVPATYVGQASKPVVCNVSENGLSFGSAVPPGVENFIELGDVPATYTGAASKVVAVKNNETGLEFISSSSVVNYDPDRAPASPSGDNDEFDDLSLNAAWTTSGAVFNTNSETDRKGFLYLTRNGSGEEAQLYKTYTPGATALTVATKIHLDVSANTINAARIELRDSGGTMIYGVGIRNNAGSPVVTVQTSAGESSTHTALYGVSLLDTVYLAINRDSGTGYDCWVSPNGHIWKRLTGASRTGTIGRLYITLIGNGSTTTEAWFDFIRVFTSATRDIGGTP